MSRPGLNTASLSDVGRIRKQNEDSFGEFARPDGLRLLVVADGMGGHRAGATASRVTVEAVGEVFADSRSAPEDLLRDAIERANARIQQMAVEDPGLQGMGTTAVLLLIAPGGQSFVAHVGDSRLYRFRDNVLRALTEDHSVVAEMQRRGLIDADQAATHPRRNEIMRSVGVESSVEVEIQAITVQPGDRYLLCSDGLSGMVDDTEIAVILDGASPEDAARELVDRANEHGGHDNVTVQVVSIEGELEPVAGQESATSRPADRSKPKRNVGPAIWLPVVIALAAAVAAALLVLGR